MSAEFLVPIHSYDYRVARGVYKSKRATRLGKMRNWPFSIYRINNGPFRGMSFRLFNRTAWFALYVYTEVERYVLLSDIPLA